MGDGSENRNSTPTKCKLFAQKIPPSLNCRILGELGKMGLQLATWTPLLQICILQYTWEWTVVHDTNSHLVQ